MQLVDEADVFQPAESVRELIMPRLSAVFRVQDCAPRADDPTALGRGKVDAEQFFCWLSRDCFPGNASVSRMQDGAFFADGPTFAIVHEGDCIQSRSGPGRTHGPVPAARTCKKDFAARSDGPAMRVVEKENVREVF